MTSTYYVRFKNTTTVQAHRKRQIERATNHCEIHQYTIYKDEQLLDSCARRL
jgi:hypothetical protein